MTESKPQDQFIIIYLHCLDALPQTFDYALFFSRMLKKGIVLLHISDPRYTSVSPAEAETKLQTLQSQFPAELTVSYAAMKGKTEKILSQLPDLFGAVLILTESHGSAPKKASNHPKQLLKNLYSSRIAYLTVQTNMPSALFFNRIVLTLDSLRESKEKVAWATYFGRFNSSTTLVMAENPRDVYLKQQVAHNMAFVAKIYSHFQLTFELLDTQSCKGNIDLHAASFAKTHGAGLLLCQTTKGRNLAHRIFGTTEEKLITNAEQIPVLFLNPRSDLYVLCE